MPVTITSPVTNANMRQSGARFNFRGSSPEANPTSMRLPQIATTTLNAPAATDNSALSVSSWRQRRQRPAPIDIRTAISLRRAAARASSRVATFTHAISSTSPPIVNKT